MTDKLKKDIETLLAIPTGRITPMAMTDKTLIAELKQSLKDNELPGCKDCPHSVGDIYQRDCGFPDCIPTSLEDAYVKGRNHEGNLQKAIQALEAKQSDTSVIVSLGDNYADQCRCGGRAYFGLASKRGPEGCVEACQSGQIYCENCIKSVNFFRQAKQEAAVPEGFDLDEWIDKWVPSHANKDKCLEELRQALFGKQVIDTATRDKIVELAELQEDGEYYERCHLAIDILIDLGVIPEEERVNATD